MEIGDRCVIVKEYNFDKFMFDKDFVVLYGTVINKYESNEDYSYHGSPWYPTIIEIRGDNGIIYNKFFDKDYSFIELNDLYNDSTRILNNLKNNLKKLKSEIKN